MDQNSSTSRYILTALAIVVVFTAFVLVGLNALDIQKRFASPKTFFAPIAQKSGDSFDDGYKAAREQFKKMCPQTNQEAHSFSGTIHSISASSLVVTQDTLPVNADVDGVSNDRTVNTDANTKIVSITQKEQVAFQQEMATFQKQLTDSPAKPVAPPVPFVEKMLTLPALKVGQRVSVESVSDVTLASSIKAVRILSL